jgi:polysaccharide chain length determinant protein (PEP-CTERM system associated)
VAEKSKRIADNTTIERVDPITLEPLEESLAFSIHYLNRDPQLAAAVATKIVNLFITYNQRTRAEQAAAAYEFLSTQAKSMETSMQVMERQLEAFKAKYGAALPEAQVRNMAAVERSQRDLDDFQREIRLAEEKESLLALQLSELSPSLTAAVSDWRTELAKLRAELALAEQRYTPEHPDVKRLRRAIADLAAQGSASTTVGRAKPDNPEYLQVQSQLEGARRDLQALRASAARARNEIIEYERSIGMSPTVEREYLQLSRDYENTSKRYQDVQGKLKDAALAQNLESEARGERFTLVRPPVVPDSPFYPNRLGIILLGFVLGSAIAFGTAAIVEASDPTVRGSDDIQGIMDMAALGAVPLLMNRADRRRRSLVWASVSAVFLVALIVVATTAVVRAAISDPQTVQTNGH